MRGRGTHPEHGVHRRARRAGRAVRGSGRGRDRSRGGGLRRAGDERARSVRLRPLGPGGIRSSSTTPRLAATSPFSGCSRTAPFRVPRRAGERRRRSPLSPRRGSSSRSSPSPPWLSAPRRSATTISWPRSRCPRFVSSKTSSSTSASAPVSPAASSTAPRVSRCAGHRPRYPTGATPRAHRHARRVEGKRRRALRDVEAKVRWANDAQAKASRRRTRSTPRWPPRFAPSRRRRRRRDAPPSRRPRRRRGWFEGRRRENRDRIQRRR